MSKRKRDNQAFEGDTINHKDKETYENNLMPTPTNSKIVHSLSLINPFGRALTTTLEHFHTYDDDVINSKDTDGDNNNKNKTSLNNSIKQDILKGYQIAMEEELRDLVRYKTGPTGLIHGNIEHFNRFGGQWRFRLSAGSLTLAPRINKTDKKVKGYNRRRSIWDGIEQHVVKLNEDVEADVLVFDDTVGLAPGT